jgi:hypothetical protein
VNILVVIYAKNCIRDITILNNVSPLEQHCNPGHGIEATKTIKTLDKIHLYTCLHLVQLPVCGPYYEHYVGCLTDKQYKTSTNISMFLPGKKG